MNTTDNLTRDCNPLGLYSPRESSVPAALLWVGLVHYYCVIIFGTLGNALALWCVATCTRTRRPIKVLLFSVFLPALVICLVLMPVFAEILVALLTCDPDRISKTVVSIAFVMFTIPGPIEQIAIAAIAVVRAVTVWAPHRPRVGMRGAVLLLVATCIYAVLTGLIFIKGMKMRPVADPQAATYSNMFYFLNITLPALITTTAYILMIVVIQRNKRRLVASQQQATVTTMDPATRAMLAVFISNLVFGVPHSIYHHTGKQPRALNIVFHIIFATHYVVDPLLYMWFNISYREKILSSMGKVIQSLSLLCRTLSVVQTGPTPSHNEQNQQNSPTHTQDDNNL